MNKTFLTTKNCAACGDTMNMLASLSEDKEILCHSCVKDGVQLKEMTDSCSKCGGTKVSIKYIDVGDIIGHGTIMDCRHSIISQAEYLKITCVTCGYDWKRDVLDKESK